MLTCKQLCGLTAVIAALIIFVIACSEDDSAPTQPCPPGDNIADCIGCHTDGDMLEATAIEDTTASTPSGEG
jgi:hypothetical protein